MWGHTARVHSLDFSADGALLVSGGADCTVRCWDVRGAGGARRTPAQGSLEAQQLAAASAEDSASGAAPTAGGEGGAIPLARSGQTAVAPPLVPSADCVTTFFTKKTPVVDVHFTPRNLCLVAGAFDTTL